MRELTLPEEIEFWEECGRALYSDSVVDTLSDEGWFATHDIIKSNLDELRLQQTLLVLRIALLARKLHVQR